MSKSGHLIKENGFSKRWPTHYEMFLKFNFNDELKESPFKVKLWHFLHQINFKPKQSCGAPLVFKNFKIGYTKFCKTNCACMISYTNDARKATSIKKYGVDSPMKLEKNRNLIREIKLSYSEDKKNEINSKRKKTNLKKYGVDNPNKNKKILDKRIESFKKNIGKWKESYKSTSLTRYGENHPWSNEEVRKKCKATMISRYGEDNANKILVFKNKIKETNFKKYGVKHFSQSDEFKTLYKNTMVSRYGVDNPSKLGNVKDKISTGVKLAKKINLLKKYKNIININENILTIKCKDNCECNGSYEINKSLYFQRIKFGIDPCIVKNPIKTGPIAESSISHFLKELGLDSYKRNDRTVLKGREIDVLLPDFNLGIEYNGIYWHSELFKTKFYHQEKSLDLYSNGLQLFHVWEDDWLYKKDIIKSMIKSKLNLIQTKIGARKCQIKLVSPEKTKNFLTKNHLQGNINSSVRVGLYYNDELVSLITLGKKRKILNQTHLDGEWELYRFATRLNTQVYGGFSKLLSWFIENYNPNKILTYASLDHSIGEVYLKNGFTQTEITKPGYYWVIDGIKKHRYNFTKQKLIKEGEDPNLTEYEIMYNRGSFRVWDSGNIKFELNL